MSSLRFGIPNLDLLTGSLPDQQNYDPQFHCVLGPDGCGKSLLAMHAASNHAARNENSLTVYVSTDLSYKQAHRSWLAFGLDYPDQRQQQLERVYNRNSPDNVAYPNLNSEPLSLHKISPTSDDPNEADSLEEVFLRPAEPRCRSVYFLDLQRESAGDDWTFLNHMVGLYPDTGPHLLVIDAVEGLEAFVGRRDAFGERRTRRSRVAQLVRSCMLSDTSVLFVGEEVDATKRTPEQFVTDTVIRLRYHGTSHASRTIEIEKCRAKAHADGEHELLIRTGLGTCTGNKENLDDPSVPWITPATDGINSTESDTHFLSHIHVVPSLHKICLDRSHGRDELSLVTGKPDFGDRLEAVTRQLGGVSGSEPGLTYILGNAGTGKSRLGRAFLAQGAKTGVAVLLTTQLMDASDLMTRLAWHSGKPLEEERLYCRRLNARHTTGAELYSIVSKYIGAAKRKATDLGLDLVHLVLDDWNLLLEMNPHMEEDPLLLPALVDLLKKQRICSIIVSTQTGAPQARSTSPQMRDLRNQTDSKVLLWNITFYGQLRTALTTQTAKTDPIASEILELRSSDTTTAGSRGLAVDPHFALYAGLEADQPQRIPLDVRLYAGPHATNDSGAAQRFPDTISKILGQLFVPVDDKVIRFQSFSHYEEFFYFADWLDDSRMNKTVVFQIDEFWSNAKPSLAPLSDYLTQPVSVKGEDGWEPLPGDKYRVFQPHPSQKGDYHGTGLVTPRVSVQYAAEDTATRADMLISEVDGGPVRDKVKDGTIDRVPYLWDFGHILARKDLWAACAREEIPQSPETKIGAVWNTLCIPADLIAPKASRLDAVGWPTFFLACQAIADRHNVPAFDVDRLTSESVSCLLLELWASLEEDQHLFGLLAENTGGKGTTALKSLVEQHGTSLSWACHWLIAMCSNSQLQDDSAPVARREWYSTSAAAMREDSRHRYSVLRLPGKYVSRGDWSLAIASGSRSRLLGYRAIDMLLSRRMNLLRLEDGFGLPVRDVTPDARAKDMPTALTRHNVHGQSSPISYGELCALSPAAGEGQRWLWRSNLKRYDRDCFYFGRWITSLFFQERLRLPIDVLQGPPPIDALNESKANLLASLRT